MNSINSTSNTEKESNYKEYLESVNKALEKIKEEYADPLDGILKYENWVCTTFFGKTENKIILEDIQKKEIEIINTIEVLEKIKQDIIKKKEIPINLKKIYIESINSLIKKFSMFQHSLRIEWEKSWYSLSDSERKIHSKKVLNLQKEIYWEPVSENKEETDDILEKLHNVFEKNQQKLDDDEKNIFWTFLNESNSKFNFKYNKKVTEEKKEIEEKWNEIKNINKAKIKTISNGIIDFYKSHFWEENTTLKDWNIREQNWIDSLNVSGIYQELRIPENYEDVWEKKITQTVISHEIEQHLLWWDSNNRFLWKGFTSWRYDFISEWLAKINEDIASWKINSFEDLKNLKEKPTIWIIWVFICENYNYENAVKIITIYNKLTSKDDNEKCKKKAIDIVKRRKRFVPYNLPWSSIKDTLYQRGKDRVKKYLTEDNSLEIALEKYKNLNIFKFWPEELKYIEEIKKELNIEENSAYFTLFIGRILHDKLNKGKWSAKNYLEEMNLNHQKVTISSKKELINILQMLKEPATDKKEKEETI
jgi:hypothetical protein